MIQRRNLVAGLLGAGSLVAARPAAARRPVADLRRLAVQFAHTGAWFRGPYRNGAAYDPGAIEELSAVLGDYRTGEVKRFDPGVLDLLWQLGNEVGVGQFSCVSGYRGAATNALVGGVADSQHLAARALDIWLPAGKLGEAVDKAVAMRAGGVGAYATWLHLDNGPVRFWDKRRGGQGPAENGGEAEAPMTVLARRGGGGRAQASSPFLRGRQMIILEPLEMQRSGALRLPPIRVLNLR